MRVKSQAASSSPRSKEAADTVEVISKSDAGAHVDPTPLIFWHNPHDCGHARRQGNKYTERSSLHSQHPLLAAVWQFSGRILSLEDCGSGNVRNN